MERRLTIPTDLSVKKGGFGTQNIERDNFEYKLSIYVDIPDVIVEDYICSNIEKFKYRLLDVFSPDEAFGEFFWHSPKVIELFRSIFFAKGCPYQLLTSIQSQAENIINDFGINKNELQND